MNDELTSNEAKELSGALRDDAEPMLLRAADVGTPPTSSAGRQLRVRREMLNLSLEEVAVQIKVAARKLAALEAERWAELPQGPYLRGLIRNYARVLDLDSDPLLASMEATLGNLQGVTQFSLAPSLRAPFPQRPAGPHESAVSRWMMVGVLLCAIVIAGLLLPGTEIFKQTVALVSARLHAPATGEAAPAATEDTRTLNLSGQLGQPDVASRSASANTPVASAASSALPAASKPSGAAPAPASASAANSPAPMHLASAAPIAPAITSPNADASLVLQFKDDSWVEVRQADGKVVSSQVFRAGTEQQIDGHAPLEVVIGNAPVVSLSYQGKPVDLDPYTRARVARLNLP